jgi:hypothetical protein
MNNESKVQNGVDHELMAFEKPFVKKESKSLFAIQNDYSSLMTVLEQSEGEINEETDKLLAINQSELNGKAIAYREVVLKKESFITLISAEIDRLTALKKREQKTIERLETALLNAVKLFGKFTVGFTTFGTRKSTSVEVTANVNDLPKEYKVVKVTEQADKTAIKEALKGGKVIEGCRLVDNENLKIN